MEDVLDLYQAPADPKRPGVCFDATPLHPVCEVRAPQVAHPRQAQRYGYKYRREGTCNLFLFFGPDTAWREVNVTQRRTALDFASCIRELVDVYYPEAEVVRVVLDNLNTHTPSSLPALVLW
jgi:hypothetical protein